MPLGQPYLPVDEDSPLQTRYDLEVERDRLGSALDAITPLRSV